MILAVVLLIALCFSFASCGIQKERGEESKTLSSEESVQAPESSESSVWEQSVIELPEESKEVSSEESVDDEPKVYPKPTCANPYITAPQVVDNGEIPIRSIKSAGGDSIQLFGHLDENNETVKQALADIQDWLNGYDKKIAFFAYALDGTAAVGYHFDSTFFSACTIKTSFIFYCCLAIDQGLADRNTVMYYQECYYHKGSGDIRLSDYGTPYTLETLIYKALNISDNVAYEMLTAYFGHDGYNKFMKDIGIPNLTLGSGLWSRQMNPKDLCTVWRELYFYFESDSPMAQVYKKACTNTKFNYCALYLGLPYSHKSGDNFAPNEVYNDGALIWADRPYVVSFLTVSEGKAEDEKTVNTISKIIYEKLMKPAYPPKASASEPEPEPAQSEDTEPQEESENEPGTT